MQDSQKFNKLITKLRERTAKAEIRIQEEKEKAHKNAQEEELKKNHGIAEELFKEFMEEERVLKTADLALRFHPIYYVGKYSVVNSKKGGYRKNMPDDISKHLLTLLEKKNFVPMVKGLSEFELKKYRSDLNLDYVKEQGFYLGIVW